MPDKPRNKQDKGGDDMIIENEFPILEYSAERDAVINPGKKKNHFRGFAS